MVLTQYATFCWSLPSSLATVVCPPSSSMNSRIWFLLEVFGGSLMGLGVRVLFWAGGFSSCGISINFFGFSSFFCFGS